MYIFLKKVQKEKKRNQLKKGFKSKLELLRPCIDFLSTTGKSLKKSYFTYSAED